MEKKGALPRGYNVPAGLKPKVKQLCQTSLLISSATACSDWTLIMQCLIVGKTLTNWDWTWWMLHGLVLWPLCSRALRGLENLVHEASHGNFHRASQPLNDRVANWLCAYWLFLNVATLRLPHKKHHTLFATQDDPDKQRFERLQLDRFPREVPRRLVRSVVSSLPVYMWDYWAQFRAQELSTTGQTVSPATSRAQQLRRSLGLHILSAGLGSLVVEQFWLHWLLYFWIPWLFYLPVHRLMAEAEEHRYENAQSVFEATFSNLGRFQRWFLHPHGDAWHLLHHLVPAIPHWQMRRAHTLLLQDPAYGGGMIRTSIFEEPGMESRASDGQWDYHHV